MGWEDEAKAWDAELAARRARQSGGRGPVALMTTTPREEFEVIDVIMASYVAASGIINAIASVADMMSGPQGTTAFNAVKQQLRAQASSLGAHAVIGLDFEVHPQAGGLTMLAYGTAIRYSGGPAASAASKGKPTAAVSINPGALLAKAGLPHHIKGFIDAGIRGDRMVRLTDLELRTAGVADAAERKRILDVIKVEVARQLAAAKSDEADE